MKPNVYGVVANIKHDFDGWVWGEVPEDLIESISVDAAQTLLQQMADDSHIWLVEVKKVPVVRFACFDGEVTFHCTLSEIVGTWVDQRGDDPDERNRLVAALEQAIATIKAAAA